MPAKAGIQEQGMTERLDSRVRGNDGGGPLLSIRDLVVSFDGPDGSRPRAVNGLSLTIHPRQMLAVVGESGCGKSVTALSVLRLIPSPPSHVERGEILFEGRNLLSLSEREMLRIRGGDIAMIFQEPMTSLNPVFSIGEQIIEAIMLHQGVRQRAARDIAIEALREVGIADPQERLRAYPHEFSGGMRQRAMIAMALACRPRLLLADEPTTALDVTIQAQILDLVSSLREERGMAIMLITHDLGIVAERADVVCVMYAGRCVEYARVEDLFRNPLHPYTRGLFQCRPTLSERRERLTTVDAVVRNSEEYRELPGYKDGVVPWWPEMKPEGHSLAADAGRDEVVLHEAAPDHWVACWRTQFFEDRAEQPANIASRREEAGMAAG
jgi:ABC-type dipeptide/oligopeptide/nickel transport system ATPase component